MRNSLNKIEGFTLIEILVSTTIVVIVATLILAGYHNSEKQSQLIFTTQKLVSDIRLAESKSLSSAVYGSTIPTGGWGIYFNTASNEYLIFADTNGDYLYSNTTEKNISQGAVVFSLPDGISIDSIKYGANLENTKSNLSIDFLPPDPKVYIEGEEFSQAKITLKDTRNNSTKSIVVNFFGLVSVE